MTKKQVTVCGVLILVSYGFGRWASPEKIKIETRTVEVEKKQIDLNKDKHKETTVTEKVNPDGTKTTVTHTKEDTKTEKKTDTDTTTETAKLKETTFTASKVTLSALMGTPVGNPTPVYGVSATKPILGPIAIGAFALTSGVVGLSLGICL